MARKRTSWLLNGVIHRRHSMLKCKLRVVNVPPIFSRNLDSREHFCECWWPWTWKTQLVIIEPSKRVGKTSTFSGFLWCLLFHVYWIWVQKGLPLLLMKIYIYISFKNKDFREFCRSENWMERGRCLVNTTKWRKRTPLHKRLLWNTCLEESWKKSASWRKLEGCNRQQPQLDRKWTLATPLNSTGKLSHTKMGKTQINTWDKNLPLVKSGWLLQCSDDLEYFSFLPSQMEPFLKSFGLLSRIHLVRSP